jgi:sarcosine oxidase subunit gamma
MSGQAQHNPTQRSPVHETPVTAPVPRAGQPEEPLVWQVAESGVEAADPARLGLADLSTLPRLGVKGPNAEEFLRSHGVTPPAATFQWQTLEGGGLVVRTGGQEFFAEDGGSGGPVAQLDADLGFGAEGTYRLVKQDVELVLTGSEALEVLERVSSFNFRSHTGEFVFTPVAGGVSCGILRQDKDGVPLFRIWADFSLGGYLWDTLFAIVTELGGGAVGAGWVLGEQ